MMRGGVSVGDIDIDHLTLKRNSNFEFHVIIGNGISRAASIENGQKWVGCVIDTRCFENFNLSPMIDVLLDRKDILLYKAPTKGEWEPAYCINWAQYQSFRNMRHETVRGYFQKHGGQISREVEIKIRNTFDFITYAQSEVDSK